jgi:toxin ParE1/3/4
MARLVIAATADADTAGILTYLAGKAGKRTAIRCAELFEKLYDRLAVHPATGALRPALGRNIRIGIVSPYIAIYRYTDNDDTVTVLRVVDSRRQISGAMLEASV